MAITDWQCQVRMCQQRANVGRHIVRPFRDMLEQRIAIRRQSQHEAFHVSAYVGVGIFAQNQRCTGVVKKHVTQALTDA